LSIDFLNSEELSVSLRFITGIPSLANIGTSPAISSVVLASIIGSIVILIILVSLVLLFHHRWRAPADESSEADLNRDIAFVSGDPTGTDDSTLFMGLFSSDEPNSPLDTPGLPPSLEVILTHNVW
jgi:hypothetical protein